MQSLVNKNQVMNDHDSDSVWLGPEVGGHLVQVPCCIDSDVLLDCSAPIMVR